MKVGILDSGIGGLTVLSLAASRMKNTEFIYYADLDNVPYGEKRIDEIKLYTENALRFLIEKGAKAVVFACNTALASSRTFRAPWSAIKRQSREKFPRPC